MVIHAAKGSRRQRFFAVSEIRQKGKPTETGVFEALQIPAASLRISAVHQREASAVPISPRYDQGRLHVSPGGVPEKLLAKKLLRQDSTDQPAAVPRPDKLDDDDQKPETAELFRQTGKRFCAGHRTEPEIAV